MYIVLGYTYVSSTAANGSPDCVSLSYTSAYFTNQTFEAKTTVPLCGVGKRRDYHVRDRMAT